MASLPTKYRISVEDLKDAPEGLDGLVDVVNTFMQSVYVALAKNLTLADNIQSNIKTLTFDTSPTYTSGTWTDLIYPISFKPTGLILVKLVKTSDATHKFDSPTQISWYYNNNITINFITGLSNSTRYTATFLAF